MVETRTLTFDKADEARMALKKRFQKHRSRKLSGEVGLVYHPEIDAKGDITAHHYSLILWFKGNKKALGHDASSPALPMTTYRKIPIVYKYTDPDR